MAGSVSIHDMQKFAESMADIQVSSDIGNVINLGEDLGDELGTNLLMSTSVSKTPSNTISVQPASQTSNDISIGTLEPLEPISLDIPTENNFGGGGGHFPEVRVHRETDSGMMGGGTRSTNSFDNFQTATGPSIQLSSQNRLSPAEEAKQKSDLLNKLSRLEAKGFQLSRRFTMDNSLDEIKLEFDRLLDARNLENSIKFQRQMMMGVVTGLEMMNNKFNPFDWQLEGWSESVHENVEDFDEVFEELYDKYKGKGNMPPEARLLFMLVGSGFMFHMSNSFFRSKMGNMNMDDLLKQNPMLAKQMAAAAAQAAGPGFGNFMGAAMGVPPQAQAQMPGTGSFFQAPNMPPPVAVSMPQQMSGRGNLAPSASMDAASPAPRREMKGPSGVDDILRTFEEVRRAETETSPLMMPTPPSVMGTQPAVQALSELHSVHSEEMMSQAGSVATASRGGRKRKPMVPSGNTVSLNV